MQIFPGAIKEYNNNLAAYWQANKDDLLIERELESLVVSQFDRLQQLDLSAYKLLCRLGCYRYQDVPIDSSPKWKHPSKLRKCDRRWKMGKIIN